MRHLKLLIFAALCSLAACGGSEDFTIKGEIAGQPNMNLYVRYYGDHALMSGVTVARDGQFEFKGRSKQPAVVELLDNEGRVLGRMYASNGDNLRVKLDRLNPYKMEVKGTDVNERWSRVVNANADSLYAASPAQANALIEEYIAANPDDVVSALLFATSYQPNADLARADSVVRSLPAAPWLGRILDRYATQVSPFAQAEAFAPIDTLRFRPLAKDTLQVFTPEGKHRTLIVFTADRIERNDSVVPELKRLVKNSSIGIVDISLCADTATWRRMVRTDSATWVQGWVPGGVYAATVDRLALPRIPYYIVTDSAGRQLYRGAAIAGAIKAAEDSGE